MLSRLPWGLRPRAPAGGGPESPPGVLGSQWSGVLLLGPCRGCCASTCAPGVSPAPRPGSPPASSAGMSLTANCLDQVLSQAGDRAPVGRVAFLGFSAIGVLVAVGGGAVSAGVHRNAGSAGCRTRPSPGPRTVTRRRPPWELVQPVMCDPIWLLPVASAGLWGLLDQSGRGRGFGSGVSGPGGPALTPEAESRDHFGSDRLAGRTDHGRVAVHPAGTSGGVPGRRSRCPGKCGSSRWDKAGCGPTDGFHGRRRACGGG